jgi:hypothetical protein
LKPTKRKASAPAYTDAELAAQIAELSKCPEGVPEDLWALTMKRQEEYIAEWKDEVTKHIREYDRTVAAKKKASAKKKATSKRSV